MAKKHSLSLFPLLFGKRKRQRTISLLLLLPFFAGAFLFFSGRVISVTDGDTLTLLQGNGNSMRVRLYGIDCPETLQRGGAEATAFARSLALFEEVRYEAINKDQYGRTVAIVTLPDGRVLNEELLKAGHAWLYTAYCKAPRCIAWKKMEMDAKKRKTGLWNASSPEPPWNWRRRKKR